MGRCKYYYTGRSQLSAFLALGSLCVCMCENLPNSITPDLFCSWGNILKTV